MIVVTGIDGLGSSVRDKASIFTAYVKLAEQ